MWKKFRISLYAARQDLIEITQMYAIIGHLDPANTLVTPWKAAIAGHYYSFRHRRWVALSYRHRLSHTCQLYITATVTCPSSNIFTRSKSQSITTRSVFWIIFGLSNFFLHYVRWVVMLYKRRCEGIHACLCGISMTLVIMYADPVVEVMCISMAECKIAVSPLLTHWKYRSLALRHRYDIYIYILSWRWWS